MWFWIACYAVTVVLLLITFSYVRHNPATCPECQRRANGLISSQHPTRDENLCPICSEPMWDQDAHNRYWHA